MSRGRARNQVELAGGAPPRTRRWFATARTGRYLEGGGEIVRVPDSLCHAKEMGSTRTACGLSATGWPRFWELPFPSDEHPSCPVCEAAAASAPAGRP